jgi:hypothetical protein
MLLYAPLNESTKILMSAMNISAAIRMMTVSNHTLQRGYQSTRDILNDCVSFVVLTFVISRLLRPLFGSGVGLVGLSRDTLLWPRMLAAASVPPTLVPGNRAPSQRDLCLCQRRARDNLLILRMKSSPTDIMIFFRDMFTLPVAATVSGMSFVTSIVFSTSSSNKEI